MSTRILVVGDDQYSREGLRDLLLSAGHAVQIYGGAWQGEHKNPGEMPPIEPRGEKIPTRNQDVMAWSNKVSCHRNLRLRLELQLNAE